MVLKGYLFLLLLCLCAIGCGSGSDPSIPLYHIPAGIVRVAPSSGEIAANGMHGHLHRRRA